MTWTIQGTTTGVSKAPLSRWVILQNEMQFWVR